MQYIFLDTLFHTTLHLCCLDL